MFGFLAQSWHVSCLALTSQRPPSSKLVSSDPVLPFDPWNHGGIREGLYSEFGSVPTIRSIC